MNFSLGEDANAHDAGDLGVKKAVNQVSGILRDNVGRPLPFVKMLLWGESFTTDSNGYFITPPLPGEETGAEVTVVNSSEVRETVFEVGYIPGTIPVVEIAVPTQTQTPQAPVARIAASAIQVTPNDVVTLSADADDPLGAIRDRLGFTWAATTGRLASGSYPWTVRWTAPAYDTVATISVVVVNGSGLSGTARVPITVGAGGENQRPAISNVTASGTTGDIEITYAVTDTENDAVSIAVHYSLDGGTSWTQTTHLTGTSTGITPGTGKSIIWHSAVDAPSATSTARIKLVPSDAGGNGTAGISPTFPIDNTSIAVVSNVLTTVGTSTVAITYDLAEPSNQACSIAVAYSLNGGTTFTQTTNVTGTTSGVMPGTSKTLTWKWSQDVTPPQGSVVLRVTADNGVSQGTPGLSAVFSLGTANSAPVVSSVIASGSSGNITIGYVLADSDGDPCTITVDYSVNGGTSWSPTGNVTGAVGVTPGSGKSLTWSSSADIATNQSSVAVRLTANDGKISGSSAVSPVFAVNNAGLTNTAPVVSSVIASGSSGNITIGYTLADAENDACSITVEYSTNGGTSWTPTDSVTGVTGIAPGSGRAITWISSSNIITNESNVRVRLTPNDGKINGTAATSAVFAVNNGSVVNTAPTVSAVIASGTSGNITIGFTLADSENDSCTIGVAYSVDGGTTWATTTNVIGSTGVTPGSGRSLTWSSSADISTNQSNVKVRLVANDGKVSGAAAISSTFSVNNGGIPNTAPVVSGVTTTGTSGNITVGYTLADNEGNACSIAVEYSLNGGTSWTPTSNVTGVTGVAPGSGKTIVWISSMDVSTNQTNVKIRLTPSDGKLSGTAVSSSVFALQNGGSAVVSSVQTSVSGSDVTITYNLTEPSNANCSIGVEYSLNAGTSWTTTTRLTGTTTGVVPGTGRTITWNAGLDVSLPQATVKVRLTPNNGIALGTPGVSDTFSIGSLNNAPSISSVTPSGTSGDISITYTLTDADSDACSIGFAYSLDGGTNWATSTHLTGTTAGVTPGAGKTLTWNSSTDFSTTQSNVKVRLVPNDGKVNGAPGLSGVFAVNNAAVATVSNVRTSVTNQTVTITYDLTDASAQSSSIQVEYSLNGGSTWTGTTQLTGTTTGVTPGSDRTIVWNSAQDVNGTQNTVKVRVTANNGSGAGPAGTSDLFTIVGANNPPVVSGVYVTGTSGNITIGYALADADSDLCSIAVAYSLDSGTNWATTTALTGTTASITAGTGKTITWNSAADVVGNYTDVVMVRVVANDGKVKSAPAVSSAFSINNNSLPVVSAVTTSGTSGSITVTYTLADIDGGASSIAVYYSTDGGANYTLTTNVTGVTSGITPGSDKTFTWISQSDVPGSTSNARLKIIPNDGTADGTPGESSTFTVNNNTAPVLSDLNVSGGTGDISIGFTLSDVDGNACSISLAYSTNNGTTWTQSNNITGGVGVTPGSGKSIVWNSAADISSYQSNVKIRITANDGYVNSSTLTSSTITVNNNNLPTISNVLVSGNSGAITITYTLADADSASCSVKVYFSTDGGGTWTQTTQVTGSVTNVAPGTNRGITWDSTVSIPGNESNVKLRLVPSDGIGNGTAGESSVFAVSNNSLPTVTSVTTSGNSGDITVSYTLNDINGDACSIAVEYSLNNGSTWTSTTNITGTLTNLAPGSGKSFVWRSSENFQSNQVAVKVRITPSDKYGAGTPGGSVAFAVNNNALPVISNVLTSGSSGTVTITYTLADADGGASTVSMQYSVDGGVTYTSASNITGATTGVTPGTGKTISWNTPQDIPGRSTGVKVKLTPNDGSGNGTPGESSTFTVNNNTLPVISGVTTSGTSGDITVTYNLTDANNNPCSVTLQYSLDGGGSFNTTKNYSGATTGVMPGNGRVITWRSASDIPGNQANVKVRLIANDTYGDGTPAESNSFSVTNNNLPSISGITITGTSGTIGITYTLADANSDACSVTVAYSTDGVNYTMTSNVTGDTSGVIPGSGRSISWTSSSDIAGYAASVRIRLIPNDGSGAGSAAISSPFAINNNTAPTVSNVLVSGTSGNVTITYNLTDPNNDQCSLLVYYSLNNGTSWTETKNLTGTVTGLLPGNGKTLVWNSAADVSGTQANVKVKLLPNDGITAGTEGVSAAFALSNNALPTVSNVRTSGSSGPITITYDLTDPNSDPCSIAVYYSTDGGTNYTQTTALTGATSSVPIGSNKTVTWNSATNLPGAATVRVKVVPSDGSGTGTPGESANFAITNNSLPIVSAVTTTGASGSIGITYTLTDADTNPCSIALYYSIDNGANYARALGTSGTTTGIVPGSGKTLTWNSYSDVTGNYGSVKLKIEPNDGYATGTAGISSGFSISNNRLPTVSSVVASGTGGDITLTYTLSDPDNDTCGIEVFYSINGGLFVRTESLLGTINNIVSGTGRTIVWSSADNIASNVSNVRVRIQPSDAYGKGTYGISSSFAVNNNNLPVVTNVTTTGTSNNVTISYDLTELDGAACSIAVAYSTDGGTTWTTTTKLTGDTTGLVPGTGKSIVWRSYEDFKINYANVKVKVTATDDQSPGTPGISGFFAVNNNHLPVVSNVVPTGASGPILLTYDLNDLDGHPASLTVEYSLNGGTTWTTTTNVSGPLTGLATGTGKTLTWNSNADFVTKQASVIVRLTPNDGIGAGASGTTAPFPVNNNYFPIVSGVETSGNSGGILIIYDLADGNNNFCSLTAEYSPDGGTTWASATLSGTVSGLTPAQDLQVFWNSTTNYTGRSTNMKIRLIPNDSFDSGVPGVSNAFTLDNNSMPYISGTPTTSGTSNDITVNYNLADSNGDPCSIQVEYSTNGGVSWAATTNLVGSTTGILPGARSIVWKSYADFQAVTTNAMVRITPSDPYVAGPSNTTSQFSLNNNVLPVASNLVASGTRGNIDLTFDLADANGNTMSVALEYSLNGGTSWTPTTYVTGTTTGLATGTGKTLVWNSLSNFSTYQSNVKLKITPSDAVGAGTATTTGVLVIDNNQYPVVSNVRTTGSSGDISLFYDLADANSDQCSIKIEYSKDNGSTWTETTSLNGPTSNITPGNNKTLTWQSASDFTEKRAQVKVRITPNDGYPNCAGVASESAAFGMNNNLPTVSILSIATPVAGTEYRGPITVTFSLTDLDIDPCSIELYYSVDNGANYQKAIDIVGSKTSVIPGVGPTITWNSAMDYPLNTGTTVKLRLAARDDVASGPFFDYATTISLKNSHKPILTDIKQVSAGGQYSAVLRNSGELYMFGKNDYGQFGTDSPTATSSPILVNSINNIKEISCGHAHTLAVQNDGSLWAWGFNQYGQVGTGTTTPSYKYPVRVSSLTSIISVAAGSWHSLALRSDGTLWAWGSNYYGQIGLGYSGTTPVTYPTQVLASGPSNFIAIAAGGGYYSSYNTGHSLALRNDGTVWAWGCNLWGQLGDNSTGNKYQPVQVMQYPGTASLTDVIAIAAGDGHSLALKSDGTVWAWGYGNYGQLGDNGATQRTTAVQVKDSASTYLQDVVKIAAGGGTYYSSAYYPNGFSLALKRDGTVWSWGFGGSGQIGNNLNGNQNYAVKTWGLTGITTIGAGNKGINDSNSAHALAGGLNGLWSWGINDGGQLGNSQTPGTGANNNPWNGIQ
ncbi:MAG: Regulator of chromosome condensation (RCC1) repeat protein [bacterium ADurb.Bin374]|nr:MAG: Regulator of chromosome condensation (RCC1) repeat protein [bacterium ADurb.Bin374]